MAQKQKIELNFSDVDDFHFKKPLKGYMLKIAEDHYGFSYKIYRKNS